MQAFDFLSIFTNYLKNSGTLYIKSDQNRLTKFIEQGSLKILIIKKENLQALMSSSKQLQAGSDYLSEP